MIRIRISDRPEARMVSRLAGPIGPRPEVEIRQTDVGTADGTTEPGLSMTFRGDRGIVVAEVNVSGDDLDALLVDLASTARLVVAARGGDRV